MRIHLKRFRAVPLWRVGRLAIRDSGGAGLDARGLFQKQGWAKVLGALSSLGLAVGILFAPSGLSEEPSAMRTQTIQLVEGWNAIFLEIEPQNPSPAAVFEGTPIELAAGYYQRTTPAQFVSDPGANLFKRAGWGVWYAASRPDAFLKTLHAVHGRQGYLVQSRSAFTWNLKGYVVSDEVRWQPNAFNLVGFSVTATRAPTFAQFFAGSTAHPLDRIYRLEGGTWKPIQDPSGTTLRSGEAFWVYCQGSSTYQGPLEVRASMGQRLLLGSAAQDVVLRNATSHPVTPRIEHIPADGLPVPLSLVIQVVGGDTLRQNVSAVKPAGAWDQPLPVLEVGEAIRVPLEARRESMHRAYHVSLLKISTDLGTETWIPVVAIRKDLEEP